MKYLLILLAFFLLDAAYAQVPIVTPYQLTVTIDAAATPERVSLTSLLATSVEIFAMKADGTANTSAVRAGFSADLQVRTIVPGGWWVITKPGGVVDLSTIWVKALTNGDQVQVSVIP